MLNKSIELFSDKTLLFIGPGQSKNNINVASAIKKCDFSASLNDVVLYYKTDLYFACENFIFDYVIKNSSLDSCKNTYKLALGLSRDHKSRIDRKYYEKIKKKLDRLYFIQAREKLENTKYTLPYTSPTFTVGNFQVLGSLQYNFPMKLSDYIRCRTLGNALQVVFGLGFKTVYLIGFLDSEKYARSDYNHYNEYVKEAKLRLKVKSLSDMSEEQVSASLRYQCQIITTIAHVYSENSRQILNLCPREKSQISALKFATIEDIK